VHFETSRIIQTVVSGLEEMRAVYSMGGGNTTILDVRHKADHSLRFTWLLIWTTKIEG